MTNSQDMNVNNGANVVEQENAGNRESSVERENSISQMLPTGLSFLGNSRVASFVEGEAEEWALSAIRQAARLPIVRIKRDEFLRSAFARYVTPEQIENIVATTPALAGIESKVIDRVAASYIKSEARRVAGLSFLAGLPGGFALAAAVPADVAQYFAHLMRIEQQLAYLYGWDSFLSEDGQVTEETISRLIVLMGVMLGVSGAEGSVRAATRTMAQQGMVKYAKRRAVLQSIDQPVMKAVLGFIGKKLGEQATQKFAGKIIPVVGGVISGGMTFMSFKPAAYRLRDYLRSLPVAYSTELLAE